MFSQTPLTKHYPPDTTACIFWLKNQKPKEWHDRTELVAEQEIARREFQTDPLQA